MRDRHGTPRPAPARRHFQPPKPRPRRRPRPWFPADWRSRVPPTLFRVLASAVMLVVPTLDKRFGDVSLAAALVGLGAMFAIGAYLVFRSEAQPSWPLPATDAVSTLVVTPASLVASSLVIADPRVGGGTSSVALASVVVVCVLIVALVTAALTTTMAECPPESSSLAFLTGPLVVAALMLGAGRFDARNAALGVSAALMVSGLAALSDGVVDARFRSMIPVVWFVMFVGGVAILARGDGVTPVDGPANAIALLTSAVAGMLLLTAPALAARWGRQRRKRIRPEGA